MFKQTSVMVSLNWLLPVKFNYLLKLSLKIQSNPLPALLKTLQVHRTECDNHISLNWKSLHPWVVVGFTGRIFSFRKGHYHVATEPSQRAPACYDTNMAQGHHIPGMLMHATMFVVHLLSVFQHLPQAMGYLHITLQMKKQTNNKNKCKNPPPTVANSLFSQGNLIACYCRNSSFLELNLGSHSTASTLKLN